MIPKQNTQAAVLGGFRLCAAPGPLLNPSREDR